ncbi:MAG: hypothetical protein CMA64_03940 [Euryarchaeota archaeon]|nr:hypothetical protein [Euryarchaeota archaeon]
MRPADIAPSLLVAALFITSGAVLAETSDDSIVDWSLAVSEGVSGDPSTNGSLVLLGDIVDVNFVVSPESSNGDERWELWIKHDEIWNLLAQGDLDEENPNLDESVELGANSTGLHEVHLRLFPSGRTQSVEFYVDTNPLDLVPAGQLGVAVRGEPLHSGDYARVSALVHNRGLDTVSAHLHLESGTDSSIGSDVFIQAGSSKELDSSIQLVEPGYREISWSVGGDGVGVSHQLSGIVSVTVMPMQTIDIASVNHDQESSTLDITVLLSEGRQRDVEVSATPASLDGSVEGSSKLIVSILPGSQTISLPIQDSFSGQMDVTVDALNWPGEQTRTQIGIDESTSSATVAASAPQISAGEESVEITYTIRNTGTTKLDSGVIEAVWVFDGRVLDSKATPQIGTSEEHESSVDVTLPSDTSSGEVRIRYSSTGIVASGTVSVTAPGDSASASELPFPLEAAALGALAGLVVILLLVLIMRTFENEVSRTSDDRSTQVESSESTVKCSNCGLSLRYSSNQERITCPACSTSMENPGNESKNDSLPTMHDKQDSTPEVSSPTDLIDCPSCEQTLKVPIIRRPVVARCPACMTTFRALTEESYDE